MDRRLLWRSDEPELVMWDARGTEFGGAYFIQRVNNLNMGIQEIMELQTAHGCDEMQKLILSGDAWKMEGSYGRAAMAGLESGQFFLPDVTTFDYYGNRVPSRDELKPGTKGTLENSSRFWEEF